MGCLQGEHSLWTKKRQVFLDRGSVWGREVPGMTSSTWSTYGKHGLQTPVLTANSRLRLVPHWLMWWLKKSEEANALKSVETIYKAPPSSLGACEGRNEVKEGGQSVKGTLLMCASRSPSCRLAQGLESLDLNKECRVGERNGVRVPSQCDSQVTGQQDVAYLRRGSLCSVNIFFACPWFLWNPWNSHLSSALHSLI